MKKQAMATWRGSSCMPPARCTPFELQESRIGVDLRQSLAIDADWPILDGSKFQIFGIFWDHERIWLTHPNGHSRYYIFHFCLSTFITFIYFYLSLSISSLLSLFIDPSVHPSTDPSIHLSIYRFIDLPTYLSVRLPGWLAGCLPVCLSGCLSLCGLSVCLSFYLSVYLSICLYVYLSICLSVYISLYLSIYQSINLSVNQSNLSI